MKNQNTPHPAFGGCNRIALGYLYQTQKCVNELNKMGLQVMNIEFDRVKPRVHVYPNQVTQRLEKTEQAFAYAQGRDAERFAEYQMMVEGIKVIWRSYLH